MLSVLSSGTLALSEELSHVRQEVNRLRGENSMLLDEMDRRRANVVTHIGWVWCCFAREQEVILKRVAFLGLQSCRSMAQTWWRSRRKAAGNPANRADAWAWLWRRKVLSVWRRVASEERRASLHGPHRETEEALRRENADLQERVAELQARTEGLRGSLASERERREALEAPLEEARANVEELQATLKESYLRQFEEAQKRELLEQKVAARCRDAEVIWNERQALQSEVTRQRDERAKCEALHIEREHRLIEASRELSLAEEVIDDVTSLKCVGLRRFFERYNLPSVLVALFRKTVELQWQIRRAQSRAAGGGTHSHASLPSGGGASCSSLHGGTSPRSGATAPAPAGIQSLSPSASMLKAASTGAGALEAEVRNHISLHGEVGVTRHALQVYIEGLRLAQVSPGMVTQVLLALLNLNLGEHTCDVARFVAALISPPSWEQLDFATALWGAAGEPAVAVVQQHRQKQSRAACAKGATSPTPRRSGLPSGGVGRPQQWL